MRSSTTYTFTTILTKYPCWQILTSFVVVFEALRVYCYKYPVLRAVLVESASRQQLAYSYNTPESAHLNFLLTNTTMTSSVVGTESLNCSFVVPKDGTPIGDVLSRWSDSYISLPAIAVTPKTEEDVTAAIKLAKENGLRVIVTGGGHGTFVQIGSKSLVLDLKLFKSIQLDKKNGSVRVGGGVTTGELLKTLANEGYYTTVPNSNAVGVIGAILGGGSTGQNGLHGFMVDNAVSFRIVTAEGKTVEVHSSSNTDELALFNVLRGAGHGLGAVTSVVMKAYPIASLHLTEDKLWTRTLVFPPPAVNDVAKAFFNFSHIAEQLNVQIVFLRAPPGSPSPGAPLLILSASFFGSPEEAEKATSVLYDDALVQKSIKADTALVPLANMNDALDALNAHGGFKSMNAARVKTLTPEAITKAFAAWVKGTDDIEDAKRSVVVFHVFNPNKLQANGVGQAGKGAFLESRDRGFNVIVTGWCMNPGSQKKVQDLVDEVLVIGRAGDGVVPRTMPNTMKFNEDLDRVFDSARLEEMCRVKRVWDSEGVFWSPYERL